MGLHERNQDGAWVQEFVLAGGLCLAANSIAGYFLPSLVIQQTEKPVEQ